MTALTNYCPYTLYIWYYSLIKATWGFITVTVIFWGYGSFYVIVFAGCVRIATTEHRAWNLSNCTATQHLAVEQELSCIRTWSSVEQCQGPGKHSWAMLLEIIVHLPTCSNHRLWDLLQRVVHYTRQTSKSYSEGGHDTHGEQRLFGLVAGSSVSVLKSL